MSHEPKEFVHTQHQKEVFRTFDASIPETGSFFRQTQVNRQDEDKVEDAFLGRSMNHLPAVYSLPSWRHLESTPVLQPVMDIPFLQNKYKYDVCSLLGIPADMLITAQAKLEGTSSKNKTQSVTRIFQAKMQRVCCFLRDLCQEVYQEIYKSKATFELIPMPRLEIKDVEDLHILFECGILQPEHTIELGSILLGSLKKRKLGDVLMQGKADDKPKDDNKQDATDKPKNDKKKSNEVV